jgi:hypothetical protein
MSCSKSKVADSEGNIFRVSGQKPKHSAKYLILSQKMPDSSPHVRFGARANNIKRFWRLLSNYLWQPSQVPIRKPAPATFHKELAGQGVST